MEAVMADEPTPSAPPDSDPTSARERIVEAFMALLDAQPFETIELGEIAAGARTSLAELRSAFGGKLAILAAYLKEIDRRVLAGIDAELAEEEPRERLFDVLMRRIEALTPHKAAVRSLVRSASRNPPLALALNGFAVRSQQWMLTAADVPAAGPLGQLRAQGLALLFASVLRTWLADDDPGLARTMSALDRALARGHRAAGLLDDLCRIPASLCRLRPRRRRPDAEQDTVAA
jgi:AcrR family transcriptional regulator